MRFSAFIKFVTFFSILLFAFLFVKTPVFAQNITHQTNTFQAQPNLMPNTNPDVPNNLHTFSQSLILEILSSISCNLSGRDPLNKMGQCIGADLTTGKLGYVQNNGGALGSMTSMIAVLYTPPLHTSDFIAYAGNSFGLAKPIYAQANGIGFTGLTPLLHAWVVFRNVVYLLFVFIFILIGLAIMMRIKIDPRTVMTIQNQIPKIIISLILVTFSFAIAGFLIDMMWVSTYAVINIMHQADDKIVVADVSSGIYHPAPQFANDILSGGAPNLGGVHSIAYNGAGSVAGMVQKFISPETLPRVIASSSATTGSKGNGCGLTNPFGCVADVVGGLGNTISNPIGTAGDVAGAIGGAILGPIGDIVGGIVSNVISWVVGIIVYLILICALLIALLKLWFALLKAYIMILIDVIFAPFWIVGGLIPGQQSAGFGAWLRDMAGNLAAFPAAIMMILLAKLFSDSFINGAAAVNATVTSNLNSTAFIPPLLGQDTSNYIASLIAIGVILATPGVVEMTKKAFKAPEMKMGAIGKSFGAGAAFVGNPTKKFGKSMFGTDPHSGQAKAGSAFVGRFAGAAGQWATGGGTKGITKADGRTRWLGRTPKAPKTTSPASGAGAPADDRKTALVGKSALITNVVTSKPAPIVGNAATQAAASAPIHTATHVSPPTPHRSGPTTVPGANTQDGDQEENK
jgi:hypothetical protein